MGSSTDWPTLRAAVEILQSFGVSVHRQVLSAHRMPKEMISFGEMAQAKGFEVIIAGAGGAAHLPGMLASVTELPVIGVPVSISSLGGADALYSIVQMPAGVPVATVGIGNAKNAGLLALRILGLRDKKINKKLREFRESQRKKAKAQKLPL